MVGVGTLRKLIAGTSDRAKDLRKGLVMAPGEGQESSWANSKCCVVNGQMLKGEGGELNPCLWGGGWSYEPTGLVLIFRGFFWRMLETAVASEG